MEILKEKFEKKKSCKKEEDEEPIEKTVEKYFSMEQMISMFFAFVMSFLLFDALSTLFYAVSHLIYTSFFLHYPTWIYTWEDFINLSLVIALILGFYGSIKTWIWFKNKDKKKMYEMFEED